MTKFRIKIQDIGKAVFLLNDSIENMVYILSKFQDWGKKNDFGIEFKDKPQGGKKLEGELTFPMNGKNQPVGPVLIEEKKRHFKFTINKSGQILVFYSKGKKFHKDEPKVFADERKKAKKQEPLVKRVVHIKKKPAKK